MAQVNRFSNGTRDVSLAKKQDRGGNIVCDGFCFGNTSSNFEKRGSRMTQADKDHVKMVIVLIPVKLVFRF